MVPDTHCPWMAIAEPPKETAPAASPTRPQHLHQSDGVNSVKEGPSQQEDPSTSCAEERPPSCAEERVGAETDAARVQVLESRVKEQEAQLVAQADTIKRLRREVERLTAVSSQFMKEKNSIYMSWRKAQGENKNLSAEIAGLKSKQHKMNMKAANKMHNMQCKVDSVLYTAQEERKAHEAVVREMQDDLDSTSVSEP